jgi:uncharacterized protein YndB with AHSA1/START domain
MNQSIIDEIRRTIVLPVPQTKVWEAITDPDKITKWFGTSATIERLAVDEPISFGWEGDREARGVITEVTPEDTFAFKWEAGKNENDPTSPLDQLPMTLVTYKLEPVAGGTRLTVVETGFASLPVHLRVRQFEENVTGWKAELKDLEAFLVE